MPTYSQTVYFQQVSLGTDVQCYLCSLFGITRKGVDGVTITGQGTQANITLAIPCGGLSSDAETFTGKGSWSTYIATKPDDAREMRRKAALLFKALAPLTISSSDYSVYGHASYLLERCATRNVSMHYLFDSPDNPYGEKLTPP